MNTSQIVVLTGQTATGKTQRALELAKEHGGALISCDSRQVYRDLDIVTGKDLALLQQSGSPYYGIDLVTANEPYSSHDWAHMATKAINALSAQGKMPIVVGGSWLYIKHLLYGFDVTVPPYYSLRKKLNAFSVAQLQSKLQELPESDTLTPLNESDRMNPHRLIRRIEILTHYKKHPQTLDIQTQKPDWSARIIGYRHANRDNLEDAISRRVEQRLQEGALDETRALLRRYGESAPGMQTIGYVQLIAHLKGDLTLKEATQEWIVKEVQYAKRQYTFMKQDASINWNEVEKDR